MSDFPGENLSNQKICESYPKLLQIYNNSLLLNGTGSQVTLLAVTASYAVNTPTSQTLKTGSTYPITSSWSISA